MCIVVSKGLSEGSDEILEPPPLLQISWTYICIIGDT